MQALSFPGMNWVQLPCPVPGPTDVLIRVAAAGLNRADLLQRAGKYPPPPGAPATPGLEVAGLVEAVGAEVVGFRPGDRVMALLAGGGMAEFALADAGSVLPVPQDLVLEEAAAIPEAFATAWQSLCWVADVQAGEWVLIHAGGSGVGTAAIQLGKALGLHVLATASGSKAAACLSLGANQSIDYQANNFAEVLGDETVDVILDPVGAAYWERNLRVLRPDGRLVLLAAMSGAKLSETSLAPILLKRLEVLGTTLRSRSNAYKSALMGELGDFLLPRLADRRIQPVVDQVFSCTDVVAAFDRLASNQTVGKVVLEMDF